MVRNMVLATLAIALAGATFSPTIASASSNSTASSAETSARDQDNTLEARQFRIENARLPGQASLRQTVTAWQITSGTWNGVSLQGLSVVLVQSRSEDRGTQSTNCYISHTASLEQREALMNALMTTQPESFSPQQLQNMRLEPAAITIDVDGTIVTLHLGLIA